ncbi:phytanoyl-CoA dioxygenase family protein [Candidatus Poribacteria bacterium]|nr:phytanoyl-CoA dioxygenase family protein [Candidatus Poribacteria bacterium]
MGWQKDSQQLKDSFDRDGFVVIPGFYTPEETAALNAHIDKFITETLPQLPSDAAFYEVKGQTESIMRLQGMASYDDHFKELTESDRFAKLAELLLDDGVVSKNMEWFTKPARSDAETPPHQDGFYFMLEPNEALTLWLALDTVNGGSHRRGMRPHGQTAVFGFSLGVTDYGETDYQEEAAIHAAPGDMIVHHCMTIHRAGSNTTANPRRALGLVYYAQRAKADAERQAAYRKELMERWEKEGKI